MKFRILEDATISHVEIDISRVFRVIAMDGTEVKFERVEEDHKENKPWPPGSASAGLEHLEAMPINAPAPDPTQGPLTPAGKPIVPKEQCVIHTTPTNTSAIRAWVDDVEALAERLNPQDRQWILPKVLTLKEQTEILCKILEKSNSGS